MIRFVAALLSLGCAAVLASACSAPEDTSTKRCDPGVLTFCRCPDNSPGLHACDSSGETFGECMSQDGSACPTRPPTDAKCGNGVLDANEECDDGNFADDDDCTSLCISARCGDGYLRAGVEECDDGNAYDDDACTNACVSGSGCGNGHVDPGEACDDGNTSNDDACLDSCKKASCGDGHLQSGVEECDDGNTSNGDGCSSGCQTEGNASYECPGLPVAVPLNTIVTVSGDTGSSKSSYLGTCGGSAAPDIVYAVTPAADGVLEVAMKGLNGSDPVLYAASGDCLSGPELGCSDSTYSGGTESLVFKVVGGSTYSIFADGYDGTSGPFSMTFALASTVPGDACPGIAVSVAVGSDVTLKGDTSLATTSGSGSYKGTGSCSTSSSTPDIVYSVTPATTGKLYAFLDPAVGGTFDCQIYARSGSCTVGPQIACSESGGAGEGEYVTFDATAGQKYSVFVDGKNGSKGKYAVTFHLAPP